MQLLFRNFGDAQTLADVVRFIEKDAFAKCDHHTTEYGFPDNGTLVTVSVTEVMGDDVIVITYDEENGEHIRNIDLKGIQAEFKKDFYAN